MRRYTSERAAAGFVEAPAVRRAGELTRQHAVNVAVGVGALVGCGAVVAWIAARVAGVEVEPVVVLYAVPVAVLAGVSAGAVALLRFTAEHRAALYGVVGGELAEAEPEPVLQERTHTAGPGVPVPGTMVRGPGGVYRRVELVLSHPELQAVREVLLSEGKATVRALAGVVGERASLLRGELVRVGVCDPPQAERAAAMLSEAGREAVARW